MEWQTVNVNFRMYTVGLSLSLSLLKILKAADFIAKDTEGRRKEVQMLL